jgi:protein SCO1/2
MKHAIHAVLVVLVGLLAACGQPVAPKFQSTDVTGANFGKTLALTDHTGKPRTLADFQGKVVVLFFGFTQCPDVCPTTLAEMAKVVKELGADGGKVQVLFVSVDPERDTPELLKQYVTAFNPSFLGMVGDAEATVRATKEFKVYVQKQPTKSGGYSVDHSAGTFILDQQGRLRLFAQYGAGAPVLLNDIKALLKQAS